MMRRKDNYIVRGATVCALTVSVVDIILQYIEHRNAGLNFNWQNFDGSRTFKRATVAGFAGGGMGYMYYRHKINQEARLPFNSNAFLRSILRDEQLESYPELKRKVNIVTKSIKMLLWNKFQEQLVNFPESVGSLVKKTALVSSFDLDIVLPFKKDSFYNAEDMYLQVYRIITETFGGKAKIYKQKSTVGLSFTYQDELFNVDIIPGKERNNYKNDSNLTLHREGNWFWQKGRQIKINSKMQKHLPILDPVINDTIKLIKFYIISNGFEIAPIFVEQYVARAFKKNYCSPQKSEITNLLNAMEYISDKILNQTLIDPANSNKNLHAKIQFHKREQFSNQLKKDIYRIQNNPRYLKEIFPLS